MGVSLLLFIMFLFVSATLATEPVILAYQDGPTGIALGDTDVYWTDSTTDSVWKCAKSGCELAPTGLAAAQVGAFSIVTDGSNVYWTNHGGGSVMKCDPDDCKSTLVTIASGRHGPLYLAVDATSVYWTETGTGLGHKGACVSKCKINDCNNQTVVLATHQAGPQGIALTSFAVFWAVPEDDYILMCGIGGCNDSPGQLQNSTPGWVLTTDATSVYWLSTWAVLKCSRTGCGAAGPIVLAKCGIGCGLGIAVDATHVYWTEFDETWGGSLALLKCAINGCEHGPTVVYKSATNSVGDIAVDSTSVYWTGSGKIMKLTPK